MAPKKEKPFDPGEFYSPRELLVLLINIPPRDPEILNGWLTQHFREFGAVPTTKELRSYFHETST